MEPDGGKRMDEMIRLALSEPETWGSYKRPRSVRAGRQALRLAIEQRTRNKEAAAQRTHDILEAAAERTSWFEVASHRENHDPQIVLALLETAKARRGSAPVDALHLQRSAIYLASHLGESQERSALVGFAHKEMANTHVVLSQWRQAMESLDEAERWYANVTVNEVELAVVLLVRSVVYQRLDQHEEALAAARAAEGIFQAYTEIDLLLKARTARGNVYLDVGRHEEAVQLWRQLALDARSQGDRETLAQVSGNLGFCLHKLGRQAEAVASINEALDIYLEIGNLVQIPRLRRMVAHIERESGEWEVALGLLLQARTDFEKLGIGISACEVLLEIGEMLIEKGDCSGAKQLLSDLPRRFADAGHYSNAIAAADYLRTAVRSDRASVATVQSVRHFVAETRHHPRLIFAPPLD
jgi:tetratricopeptide (TPR) repeat protein